MALLFTDSIVLPRRKEILCPAAKKNQPYRTVLEVFLFSDAESHFS
jgi:hypothetical protein